MHPYLSEALAAERIKDARRSANAARRAVEARQTRPGPSRFAALAAALRGGQPASAQATAPARFHVRRA